MHELTRLLQEHYASSFEKHGATPQGVDAHTEEDQRFRYDKMLAVMNRDFDRPAGRPSLLDVGCGWGGLLQHCRTRGVDVDYAGIDVVEAMIVHAKQAFPDASFVHGDILTLSKPDSYDYVVCNGILWEKLTATLPQMQAYSHALIRKMFEVSRFGLAFNMLSTRVNFMGEHLYYQNPLELLDFCLTHLSPKVRLDHGYSSLATGRGRFYDFTAYVYKN